MNFGYILESTRGLDYCQTTEIWDGRWSTTKEYLRSRNRRSRGREGLPVQDLSYFSGKDRGSEGLVENLDVRL